MEKHKDPVQSRWIYSSATFKKHRLTAILRMMNSKRSHKRNNYLALVTPNHMIYNGFSIFHHSCLCVFMCVDVFCGTWLIFAVCFSIGPLGQGLCSRVPFSYITQQTRPPTAEQLVVTVSYRQRCPSGTIQWPGLSPSAATFRFQSSQEYSGKYLL